MSAVAEMPSWDLAVFFSGPNDPKLAEEIRVLTELTETYEALLEKVEDNESYLAKLVAARNAASDTFDYVASFLECTIAADTRDTDAQARLSELDKLAVRLTKAATRMAEVVGKSSANLGAHALSDHSYSLEKMRIASRHQMSAKEEELAADLSVTGSSAWERLFSNFSSMILVEFDGEALSMSRVRALAYDLDRRKRQNAYEAELAAWKKNETVAAACLNSIKGEVGTLAARRNWNSELDIALFHANINREALEAMLAAARESFPDFRRYLHAKNKLITGTSGPLAWFDIFAPVGKSSREWTYSDACDFVAETFDTYSPSMGEFARRTYRESWHDVPPKIGKVDGAFCAGIHSDVSRILLNFKPSFGSVATLAHELGHAYHNLCLSSRTNLQRKIPMTLAETASIFCETLCRRAGLTLGSPEEQLSILEMALQGACQQVVDITSRFIFESSVFEKRTARELSAEEFCDAMENAQEQTYGAGLAKEIRHSYMWAAKPHYYSTYSFYNFPYMFGLLFSLGLFSEYENGREGFHAAYDDLLSSSGMASAEDLGKRFGIDINDVAFWRSSLDVMRKDIDRFVALTEAN